MTDPLHRVSCKAAIYNSDGNKILLMRYNHRANHYGLPGGHLENGESPEDAVIRELEEELGLKKLSLEPQSFFMHHDKKIVLCFTGKLTSEILPPAPNPKLEQGEWIKVAEIDSLGIDPGFAAFVKTHQPRRNNG